MSKLGLLSSLVVAWLNLRPESFCNSEEPTTEQAKNLKNESFKLFDTFCIVMKVTDNLKASCWLESNRPVN